MRRFDRARTPGVQALETRVLFAGDVQAGVDQGVLSVVGDGADNGIVVTSRHERARNQSEARGGVTSVSLDTELLEAAANLELSGADSAGRPARGFDVGFPITRDTDFVYQVNPFAPVGGTIRHEGTVSFNDDTITVGDFEIGFDPARAGGDRSGFFVRDTAAGLGILFDVGAPDSVTSRTTGLTVRGADLLVSPEFAAALRGLGLASADLTGADVGDARIDAFALPAVRESIVVSGLWKDGAETTVNGARSATFPAGSIEDVVIDAAGGDDRVVVSGLRVSGALSVDGGDFGDDSVSVAFTRAGRLGIRLGEGRDYLNILGTTVDGLASLNGEDGRDILVVLGSRFGSNEIRGFEFAFPPSL